MPNVLLVEDDVTTRNFLALFLTRMGLSVLQAGEGMGALATLRSVGLQEPPLPIHLVVTDIEMPGMNGLDLLAVLRNGPHKGIPCVAISGHPDKLDLAMAGGARAALLKPIKYATLEPVVRLLAPLTR